MSITINSRSRKVIAKLENLDKALPRNLRRGLYTIGSLLEKTASKNIQKRGRQGRVYKYKGRRHVASVPGESWANRSGKTRRSIVFKVRGSHELMFGNTSEIASFLEDGTRKMKPRPAHLISIKQNNRNIIKISENQIKKSLV